MVSAADSMAIAVALRLARLLAFLALAPPQAGRPGAIPAVSGGVAQPSGLTRFGFRRFTRTQPSSEPGSAPAAPAPDPAAAVVELLLRLLF